MKHVSTLLAVVLLTFSVLGAIPFRLISEDILPDVNNHFCMCPADFDNDGLVDLVVSTLDSGTLDLYEQTAVGSAEFELQIPNFLVSMDAGYSFYFDIVDFNGNGLDDIIIRPRTIYNPQDSPIRFEQSQPGSYDFEQRDTQFLTPEGENMYIGYGEFFDVDQDGLLDYMCWGPRGIDRWEQTESDLEVWESRGFFLLENIADLADSSMPAFGDVDGDEYPDVVYHGGIQNCVWFEWDGTEFSFRDQIHDLYFDHLTLCIRMYDIDGDGLDDYLGIPEYAGDTLEYWRNNVDTTPADNPDAPAFDSMLGVYPNPFNPETTIRFELSQTSRTTLTVYDIHGRQVDILVNGTLTSGVHEVVWNAEGSPSGVYLTRLQTAGGTFTKRVVLMK